MNTPLETITLVLSLAFIFLGLPNQIYKIWRTRTVTDVSLPMFCLLAAQSLAFVLLGFQRTPTDWVIAAPNAFVVLFASIIVVLYFKYRGEKH